MTKSTAFTSTAVVVYGLVRYARSRRENTFTEDEKALCDQLLDDVDILNADLADGAPPPPGDAPHTSGHRDPMDGTGVSISPPQQRPHRTSFVRRDGPGVHRQFGTPPPQQLDVISPVVRTAQRPSPVELEAAPPAPTQALPPRRAINVAELEVAESAASAKYDDLTGPLQGHSVPMPQQPSAFVRLPQRTRSMVGVNPYNAVGVAVFNAGAPTPPTTDPLPMDRNLL